MKAGIIEIADIHVVNKTDREGAERTIAELRALLAMQMTPEGSWSVPVIPCVATAGQGVPELLDQLQAHLAHLHASGEMLIRERRIAESRVLKEKHLRLQLVQNGGGRAQAAIYFGGAQEPLPPEPWDAAFQVARNEFNGRVTVQMEIKALRTAEAQP